MHMCLTLEQETRGIRFPSYWTRMQAENLGSDPVHVHFAELLPARETVGGVVFETQENC